MKKFFSGQGDKGSTGTLGKIRVPKSHPRIRAVGAIDEASAALGMARALADDPELAQVVKSIQLDLYQIMSLVVLESPDPDQFPDLSSDRVAWLEEIIQKYQEIVEDPQGFILPGDTAPAAAFGMARTIIRRAERETVELDQAGMLHSETTLPYLNRLSTLCFVLELFTSENYTPVTNKKS
jgi:cob(I)alamin adenosyltransferase